MDGLFVVCWTKERNSVKDLIPRQTYIDRMMPFLGSRVVKVVTGMRRCGKSTFLRMFMRHLAEAGVRPADEIVYVDLEAFENADVRTAADLAARVKALTKRPRRRNLLFLDEVQYVEEWERTVAAFAGGSGNYEVFLSGSSAKLFAGELATRLSGRFVEFPVLPLSLAEFERFSGVARTEDAFPLYLRYGALPGIHDFRELSDETVFPYLRSVYDTILVKDVLERNNIRNVRLAQDVIRYVFEEYAKGASKKEIIDELNRRGYRNRNGKPLTLTSFQHAMHMTTYYGDHVFKGQVIPGCATPIITKETFDKVQVRLAKVAHAPAATKAKIPYILQGKIFCGICGAPMFGESGKSHTGAIHSYYSCYTRKRKHACTKKNERREQLENYIIEQTMKYILTPSRMKAIARMVVKEYDNEFSASRVDDMTRAITRIDAEMEKLVDALIDAPKVAYAKIYARMEQLEAQKREYELDAAKLRVAMNLSLTEKEVVAWLQTFRAGDPADPDFRRRLIDIFINSIYLYEDRIIVFYNIRTGNQVTYDALPETLANDETPVKSKEKAAPKKGSALNGKSGAGNFKSEPIAEPMYVFVSGVFGCLYYRA